MRISGIFLAADGRLRPSWRALLFLPVWFVLFFLFSTVALNLPGGLRILSDVEWALMASGLGAALSALLAAFLFLALLDRRSFRNLGLWFYEGWGRELAIGLAGGVVLISIVVGSLVLLGLAEFHLSAVEPRGALLGLGWNVVLLFPAAAAEELLFRGYPFQRLVEGWGAFAAILLLSVLFGLAHLQNPSATPLSTANTALVGILLALAYLRTRGLWLPIGLHFAWNFWLGTVVSLPVSGIELSGKLLGVEVEGPVWLSGGEYGPEGSIVATAVVLAASVWLARTPRLGVSPAQARELE